MNAERCGKRCHRTEQTAYYAGQLTKDDCVGVVDVLRGSAGHDELQGLANDQHNCDLYAGD